MQNTPFFRRRLAHRLRNCAARRRVICAGDPTGEDLKVIALFDRLAQQAEQLPQALIDEVAQDCIDPVFARRFDEVWETLSDVVGILVVPGDTGDLVRWMMDQARHGPEPDLLDPASKRSEPARWASERSDGSAGFTAVGGALFLTAAADFAGAFAVAGPMLAVLEGATAIGQWRDQAFATSHLTATATVASVTTVEGGRSIVPPSTETLVFTPVGERMPCSVPVQVGNTSPDAPGQTLTVVPRSGACEAPLIPARLGDSTVSMLIALAFLAGGVASLKGCIWLRRQRVQATPTSTARAERLRVAL